MKHAKRKSAVVLLILSVTAPAAAQKKVHRFTESRVYDLPAQRIWAVVGEDYGAVAYSHPKIIASEYINGSLKAEEGAERVCNFNEKGTRFLKERMINYDPEHMQFTNTVYQSGKFPVDPRYTRAFYRVESLPDGRSRFTFDMQYRTKPAFMGGFAKGNFRQLIRDYMIAIEHHARTGEAVTKENFKQIKKKYQDKES